MNNFDHAISATETALNSAGSAATENSRYMESLNAKTNQLKATFQDLANNVIESQLVKSILDLANGFLTLLNTPIGTFVTQLTLLTTALYSLQQLSGAMNIFRNIAAQIKALPSAFTALIGAIKGTTSATAAMGAAMNAALPILALISAAIIVIPKIVDAVTVSLEEQKEIVENISGKIATLSSEYETLNNKISSGTATQQEQEKLSLLEKQLDIQNKLYEIELKRQWEMEGPGAGGLIEEVKAEEYRYEALGAQVEYYYQKLEELGDITEDNAKKADYYTENITRYQDSMVEHLGSMGEYVAQLEEYQDLGVIPEDEQEEVQAVIDLYYGLTDSVENYGISLETVVQTIKDANSEQENALNQLSGLTENYNILTSAVEEYNSNGSFTIDTINSLLSLGNEYISLLTLENGKLVLNSNALYEKANQLKQNAVQERIAALSAELYTIATEGAAVAAENAENAVSNATENISIWDQTVRNAALGTIGLTEAVNSLDLAMGADPSWLGLTQQQKAAMEEAIANAKNYINLVNQVSIAPSFDREGRTSSSTSKTVDLIEEQNKIFEEQNRIIEDTIALKKEQGANEEELIELNKKYQDQLHEQADWFRANGEEETSEYIMDRRKMYAELDNENEEYYQSILQRGRDAWDEQLDVIEDNINWQKQLGEWAAQDYVNAWAEALGILESLYAQDVVDFEYYQEQKKDLNRELILAQKEAQEEAERLAEEAQQALIDSLQEKADAYETAFSYMVNQIQKEIDLLQEQRDIEEQYWDDKIQALEDQNDELEKQIELEEALDNLARARQTKVMVYKDGRFQYISDIDQVSEAQANLEKLEREEALRQEVENLETLKDQALASIDEQIKGWEKYKEEWSSVVENYQEEQDKLIAEQVLGIELEGDNWQTRLDNLSGYISQYEALMARLAQAQANANAMIQQEITGSTTGGSWGSGGGGSWGSGGGSGSISSLAPNWGGSSGLTNWVGGTIQGEDGSIMDGKVAVIKSGLGGGAAPVYYDPTTGKVTSSGLGYGDIVLTQGGAYMITGGTAGNYTSVPYTGGSSSSSGGGGSSGSVWDDDGNWVGTGNTGTATDWENRYEGDDWSDLWWEAENDPTLSEEERDDLQDYFHDKKEEEMSGSGATFNPGSGKWEYATGTLSAHGGLSLVGEKGPELRVLGQGEGIIPSDITKNLWSWGTTSPNSFMGGIAEILRSIGEQTGIIIQNFNPNLPNITDVEGFVTYMKNNFWREAVQFSKT